MRRVSFLIAGLCFTSLHLWAESAGNDRLQNLEGRYERTGIVDRSVEAQYKGLGIVLVPPVFIDELLACPRRGTREDTEFIFRRQGSDYVLLFPKEDKRCRFADYDSLAEVKDGTFLLRRRGVLGGEGNKTIYANEEVRLSKESLDGAEWLVVETRIEWTKRSFFRSKKMEYRSLVRFREIVVSP